jgi:hypothetical protein
LEKLFRETSTVGIMLHHAVADHLGLHLTDHKCVGMLCEAGSLSAGQLAERAGLTTGAITGVINRLEKMGYARRIRNPKDKRNVNVVPRNVANFGKRMHVLLGPLGKKMRALSSSYTAADLAMIEGFITSAIAISREETLRLRSKPASTPRTTMRKTARRSK